MSFDCFWKATEILIHPLFVQYFLYLQLTWADIAIANVMDLCLIDVKIDKEKFKKLYALMNQVFETTNIKKYLATRPKSAAWL